MSMQGTCRTYLIPDDPADNNIFPAVERIADAIAEIIRHEEKGGKAIGLEGNWGSGKTTIVNQICSKFVGESNYTFFLFDAWAHEGDPLRRTFIEELIDHLIQNNWIDSNYWSEQKEIIAQRKEIKKTKNKPHVTMFGMIVIVLFFLVPIGVAFLNAALKDNLTIDLSSSLSGKFLIGLTLTLSPLFAVFIGAICQFIGAIYQKLCKKNAQSLEIRSLIWTMLINKAISKEQTKTNKTTNPTSVEFEKIFGEIMKAALTKDDRKIVLVLDNLDRIAPSEALKIWATLQTFLRPRTHTNNEWLKRLWIIMPYDLDGISSLWNKPKTGSENKKEITKPQNAQENVNSPVNKDDARAIKKAEANENILALSFLDKCFQIRFEVPPPVLSNWQDYLFKLCQKAFPNHQESEFHIIYKLYVWFLYKQDILPNPRQLILYVNQIGSLHMQWCNKIPLSHLAYYALLRRLNINVVEELLKGDLPHQVVEGFLDDKPKDNLAALAFNVDAETAKQIVLMNPLKEAFEIGSVEKVQDLYRSHYDNGFWQALDNHLDWKLLDNKTLATAAYCLYESGIFNPEKRAALSPSDRVQHRIPTEIDFIKNAIKTTALKIPTWQPLNNEMSQGLIGLFSLLSSEEFTIKILGNISSNFAKQIDGHPYPIQNVEAAIAALKQIRESLKQAHINVFSQGIIEPMATRLRSPNPLPYLELNPLLGCMVELSVEDELSRKVLQQVASDKNFVAQIKALFEKGDLKSLAISQEYYQTIGLGLFILLRDNPKSITPDFLAPSQLFKDWMKELGQNSINAYSVFSEKLAEILINYGETQLIINLFDGDPTKGALAIECLKIITSQETSSMFFTLTTIDQNWDLFKALIPDSKLKGFQKSLRFETSLEELSLSKLINQLVNNPESFIEVTKLSFNSDKVLFYVLILYHDGFSNNEFINWVSSGLKSISKEQWLSDLQTDGKLFTLIASLSINDQLISLPNFQDAILGQSALILNSQLPESGSFLARLQESEENLLIKYSSPSFAERNILCKKIYNLTLERNGEFPYLFLKLFGREITRPEIIQGDERVLSDLFVPILNQNTDVGLAWLEQALKQNLDSLKIHSKSFTKFRDTVRDILYKNTFGDKVKIKRLKSIAPVLSVAVRRGEVSDGWAASPSQKEFEVDWATAEAAFVSQAFVISNFHMEGGENDFTIKNPKEIVNIAKVLEIPPLNEPLLKILEEEFTF
ncbi:MAG: P-loop NTPase fold protein [Acidobacteriota bacterium]